MNFANIPMELLGQLQRALERRALLAKVDGELHAVVLGADGAHRAWKLSAPDDEHVVRGGSCSCGGAPKCSCYRAVKFGSEDTASKPWKYKRVHRKRKVRNPNDMRQR